MKAAYYKKALLLLMLLSYAIYMQTEDQSEHFGRTGMFDGLFQETLIFKENIVGFLPFLQNI